MRFDQHPAALLSFVCTAAAAITLSAAEPLAIGSRKLTPAEITRFAAALNDPDDAKAIAAANALGDSGQPAVFKPLLDFYQNSTAARRLAAAAALGKLEIPERKKKSDTIFRIAVGDSSQAVRALAIREAAKLDGAENILKRLEAFILDATTNPALYRCRAIHSAVLAAGKLASPMLRAQLDSTEVEVALAAIDELAELREVLNADTLLRVLESDCPELKSAAANALVRLSGKNFGFDLVQWNAWRKEAAADSTKQDLPEPKPDSYAAQKPPVDFVIALDTTGSFLHVWTDVGRAVEAVLRELVRDDPTVRLGLVRYRSLDPRATLKYTLKISPLTYNTETVRKELSTMAFGGGSGALHEGMRAALNHMPWRARAKKVLLIIGDDSPSSPVENGLLVCAQLARDAAAVDQIQVNTLFAKTAAGEENRQTYRLISEAGIGRFYEFNKAERHLVDMLAEKIDVKQVELPAETARKWIEPRTKK